MELKVLTGRKNLVQLQDKIWQTCSRGLGVLARRASSRQSSLRFSARRSKCSTLDEDSAARKESDRETPPELDRSRHRRSGPLNAREHQPEEAGNRIRSFTGEGYRQYLTGMRMGGERIVILVDVSTSMLDRTLVNILRRRNMSAGAAARVAEVAASRRIPSTGSRLRCRRARNSRSSRSTTRPGRSSTAPTANGCRSRTAASSARPSQHAQARAARARRACIWVRGRERARARSPTISTCSSTACRRWARCMPARAGVTGKRAADHFEPRDA